MKDGVLKSILKKEISYGCHLSKKKCTKSKYMPLTITESSGSLCGELISSYSIPGTFHSTE